MLIETVERLKTRMAGKYEWSFLRIESHSFLLRGGRRVMRSARSFGKSTTREGRCERNLLFFSSQFCLKLTFLFLGFGFGGGGQMSSVIVPGFGLERTERNNFLLIKIQWRHLLCNNNCMQKLFLWSFEQFDTIRRSKKHYFLKLHLKKWITGFWESDLW